MCRSICDSTVLLCKRELAEAAADTRVQLASNNRQAGQNKQSPYVLK